MPKISKAVIACGGWSTRFLPTVKTYAKQMVPIVDRPQIQHVVEGLIAAGITEIMIVHNPGDDSLKKYFTADPVLENFLKSVGKETRLDSWHAMIKSLKRIEFAPQTPDLPYGNGTPILVAKDFIGQDSFVYLFGDDIVIEDKPGTCLTDLNAEFEKYQPAALAAAQLMSPERIITGGSIKYLKDASVPNQMEFLIEKPESAKVAPSLYMTVSPFVLSPKVIEALTNTPIIRGELWLPEALNTLARTEVVICPPLVKGHYATTGDPLNWLKVNFELALKNPLYKEALVELFKNT